MEKVFFCAMAFLFSTVAWAHGEGDDHEAAPGSSAVYAQINQSYLDSVQPIFKKKCFDCHSDQTKYPWYHAVPGVKQLIDYDVREAKEHLDLSFGFPFRGHGSQAKTLEEILEVVEENEMPLWYYRIMHPGSKVTEEEKTAIRHWVKASLELLGQK